MALGLGFAVGATAVWVVVGDPVEEGEADAVPDGTVAASPEGLGDGALPEVAALTGALAGATGFSEVAEALPALSPQPNAMPVQTARMLEVVERRADTLDDDLDMGFSTTTDDQGLAV